MWIYNWIKSFFSSPTETILEKKSNIKPPYSTLTINQVEEIQNIIEKYSKSYNQENPDYNNIQEAYNKLLSISTLDENIRLYLHELMLFSSIRIERTPFYVDLSKLIIKDHPHLQNFVESQIFWCFDNSADLYVYNSIEKGLLKEDDLKIFEKSVLSEFQFYDKTDFNYNPFFRYIRFLYLIQYDDSNFESTFYSNYYSENKNFLKDPDYRQKMRICLNNDQTATHIRNDKSELIGSNNENIDPNIIDRNELLCFGCNFLEYAAFYGSKSCFQKIFDQNPLKNRTVKTFPFCGSYYEKTFDLNLCDFAACGGNIEICKEILNKGFQFTSQSLRFSIRYHRYEIFEWLTKELNIEMDDDCYKDSFLYEFIPGIKMYDQIQTEKVNINLEVSKSGNYVLFTKFIEPERICVWDNNRRLYRFKYAPFMPIFVYNSIDCYRYFLTLQLDLNECSWFDSRYYPPRFGFPYDLTNKQYRNPFHVAIERQFTDLIQMILEFGVVDVNKREFLSTSGGVGTLCIYGSMSMTPLEIAIKSDNPSILNFLLSVEEIDVNQVSYKSGESSYSMGRSSSSNEWPILKVAAFHGNLEMIEILLKSPRINKNVKCHLKSNGTGYSSFNNKDEYEDITKNITDKKVIDLLAKYGVK